MSSPHRMTPTLVTPLVLYITEYFYVVILITKMLNILIGSQCANLVIEVIR